jgi:hypothetical protein
MNSNERCQLVLSLAEVLYTNGQSTEQVVTAAERLASAIGVRGRLLPRWGEGKYPPAEPGALGIGPLEAAVRGADATLHPLAT